MKLKVQKKPQLAQDCLIMTDIKNDKDQLDDYCEECGCEDESVSQNLLIFGYKICASCKISKTIFPI